MAFLMRLLDTSYLSFFRPMQSDRLPFVLLHSSLLNYFGCPQCVRPDWGPNAIALPMIGRPSILDNVWV